MKTQILVTITHNSPIPQKLQIVDKVAERTYGYLYAQGVPVDVTVESLPEFQKCIAHPEEGWIDWNGGKCPVDPETLVRVLLREGRRAQMAIKARSYYWNHYTADPGADIVAYRVEANNASK